MKKPLGSRAIAFCFGFAVTILSWMSLASYWSTHQLVRSFDAVTQAHQALEKLQHIEVLMETAESSVQGYVITGEPRRLDGYRDARRAVPSELRQVEGLVSGHPREQRSLQKLNRLLSSHLAYLSHIADQRQNQGYDTAAQSIVTENVASPRDAMEQLLSEVQEWERHQVQRRWGFTSQNSLKARAVLVFTTAVSLGLLVWVFGLLRRETDERRDAESATQRTETFLHSIVERIPYMILVKEAANLRLTLVNKAAEEWLGRSKQDLLGSNEFDLRPREEALEASHMDREVLSDGKPSDSSEESLVLPGRDPRILRTQKIPVSDDEGHPAFLLTISEDVTQRKQAEKMLELSRDAAVESARLKSEFIRNMSHEIRTPLSIVLGMTSLLLDTELTAEQRRFASTVHRAAEGLSDLSKSILDFSRIEAGAFTLEAQEVHVRQIVEGVITMLGEQAKAKRVGLVSLISNDIPTTVIGDAVRLRQVVTQLIGNAVKFTEHGEVIVRVTEAKQSDSHLWLQCRISDTGIGIPEEAQKHLFEAFRQGDGSHTRRFGGTGLGLAISKRIVELMGGEIGFESVPGKGSTFSFTIPFAKRHMQGPRVQVRSLPWTQTRVLVVDENKTYCQFLQEQLSTWALASEVVSSGQTALELLRREQKAGRPFPIVFFDMHLPDMDGVTFARFIRNEPALADTKLLVMTSSSSPLDAATCASLGFTGWIARPPKPEEFFERLATLIERPDPNHQHAA